MATPVSKNVHGRSNAPQMKSIDSETLRRVALARQGLRATQPFGMGLRATLKAIRHLGYVQIDTISVVARAHNHVLRSRVPNFSPIHIDRLLKQRKIFEYRFPVAAFRPIEDYRFTRLHAAKFRAKPRMTDKAMLRHVMDRISNEGALRSRDFEHAQKTGSGWWDWKPAKSALEQLYFQGDLMISARDGFEKSYDLTERVLPTLVDSSEPTLSEFAGFLLDSTLRAHGFATYATFAAGARQIALHGSLKVELKRRVEDGTLHQYSSETGTQFWAKPETVEIKSPPLREVVRILSPFDNLVIRRERLQDVFNFEYRIECYVPEPNRKFGYYCLPIVYADQLVGRMDCKSHRDDGLFEIKALFLEPEFASRAKVGEFADPFAAAVVQYANFEGCDEVIVTRAQPASAKKILRQAIASIR